VTEIWIWLIVAATPLAVVELLLLYRCRQALLSDAATAHTVPPRLPEEVPAERTPAPASNAGSAPQPWSLGTPRAEAPPTCASEALLCFGPGGQCTAANLAGRQLLPRPDGGITLSDLLPGGAAAAASLLARLAAEGLIEGAAAIVPEPTSGRVHMKALALRDRDNNFWGAALFIRPALESHHLDSQSPAH
jgi:hypothetical protein